MEVNGGFEMCTIYYVSLMVPSAHRVTILTIIRSFTHTFSVWGDQIFLNIIIPDLDDQAYNTYLS